MAEELKSDEYVVHYTPGVDKHLTLSWYVEAMDNLREILDKDYTANQISQIAFDFVSMCERAYRLGKMGSPKEVKMEHEVFTEVLRK